MSTSTTSKPASVAEAVAVATAKVEQLEVELATLPDRIEEATEAGDDSALASLLVRDRILERQLAAAREELRLAPLPELREAVGSLRTQCEEVHSDLADLELARDVYATALEQRTARLALLRKQFANMNDRLMNLTGGA